MKTPEEIKKGLAMCSADECHGQHTDCPYHPELMCIRNICADAIAMIRQLEAENAELKRELDAAAHDLTESKYCHACKHCEEKEELAAYNDVPAQCVNCAFEVSQFLWRGPLPEPPKEDENDN